MYYTSYKWLYLQLTNIFLPTEELYMHLGTYFVADF